jgi:hypothetical protein
MAGPVKAATSDDGGNPPIRVVRAGWLEGDVMTQQTQVTGSFNYVGSMDDEPVYFKDQPERTNIRFEAHVMPVADIRGFDSPPTLEREGFMLANLRLDIGEERDPEAIHAVYQPLLHEYLTELTGAPKIVVKKPMLRWSDRGAPAGLYGSQIPARYVHCDFDANSFHQMARDVIADDPERDRWLAGRYACVQTWRALSPPPQDMPLAVVDRRTLRKEDLVLAWNILGPAGKEQKHKNYTYRHSPGHSWAYISNMTSEETLVFMGYDSADDEMTGSPHSSFEYWRHCDHTVPRNSAEVRAFVYWG